MNTDNVKLLLSALGVGSLFVLVCLGKLGVDAYVPLIVGAVGALGGHAVGSSKPKEGPQA